MPRDKKVLTSCIKVFSSEHELDIGGATWLELERMDITKGVLPIHDDIYFVQIHTGMHVYEAVLRPGVIDHHRSVLVIRIDCYGEVRDGAQQVGVVAV